MNANDPLDLYSYYLAGFTKALLGEGVIRDSDEVQYQAAAALGIYDGRRAVQPAPAREVADRVQRLMKDQQQA